MGGSSSTMHMATSFINQRVHNTNNNLNSETNNYHINTYTNNAVHGTDAMGRSVVINGGANAGTRCFGMSESNPACHSGLIMII